MMALNDIDLERIRIITRRIEIFARRLTTIREHYYRYHPPLEELEGVARINARIIAGVPTIDWATINRMMNDYNASPHYDLRLLIAARAMAHLQLILPNPQLAPNDPPWWARPIINAAQNIRIDAIEERLGIVESWLNTLEHELMRGLLARAGAAMGRVRGYFRRNN